MTRIRATSLLDLQFQQNDTPPTRAQKLELLRTILLATTNPATPGLPLHLHPISDVIGLQAAIDTINKAVFYRFGSFWVSAPLTNETMMLHPVTDDVTLYENMIGSIGDVGGLPLASMVFTVWKNPILTGELITGGEQVGTFTISTLGVFTFATTGGFPVRCYRGDVIGVKAPTTVQASAKGGSFTLFALVGAAENYLAMIGDQTDGDDVLMLKGDQQGGLDLFTLSGDQLFGALNSLGVQSSAGFLIQPGPAGPAGPAGATGAQGATGAVGPAVTTYLHTQASAANLWTVNHNKGDYPVADVLSVGGIVVDAEIEHTSVNQLVVRFAGVQTGSVVVR